MSCASERDKHTREKTTSSSSRVWPFISNVIRLSKPETLFMHLNTTSLLETFLVKWQKRKSSCKSCWRRVFFSCEKHLSHLWDVWKIKSKRKIGILLYITLLLMASLNLKKMFFVLGSSSKYLLDDSQQPHQRACALGSEPVQAKGWLCHSFNAWKTHKLRTLYRETNSWELWSKICRYRIGCPVFLDHLWKHVLFNG